MKNKKTFFFAMFFIIVGVIIAAVTFALYGNDSMGIYKSNGKWDYIKPVATDGSNIITGTVEIPAGIKEMNINVSFFDLQFVESDEYKIEYSYNSDFSNVDITQDNTSILFESSNNNSSMFNIGFGKIGEQVKIGYSAHNRYDDNKITVYIDSNREFEKFNIVTSHLNNVANVSNISSTNVYFDVAHDDYIIRNLKTGDANFNFQHSEIEIYNASIDDLQLFKAHTNTRVSETNIGVLNKEMQHSNLTVENSSIGEANIDLKHSTDSFENTSVGKFNMVSMSHSEFAYNGDMIKQMDLEMNQSTMMINMKNTASDKYTFNFNKNFSEVLVDGSDLYTIYNGENKISGNLNHSNIDIYFD